MRRKKKDKKVDINCLSPERQKKVRKIRGRLKKGTYSIAEKVVDDKTVGGVLKDINSA